MGGIASPNAISIGRPFFLNYVRPSPIPIGALLGGLMSLILGGSVSKSHIEGTLEDMCSRILRYIVPSPHNCLIAYLGGGIPLCSWRSRPPQISIG